MSKKIPVFYHVPKCAGTYVQHCSFKCIRRYCNNCIRTHLQDANANTLAILFSSPIYPKKKGDKPFHYVLYDAFKRDINIPNIQLKFVIICDHGFRVHKDILCTLGIEYKPYMLWRNPYERAYSIYNYLLSDNSFHEATHNKISSRTFEEYLQSYELEDSWLIRHITPINDDNKIIDKEDFDKATKVLDSFDIRDISDANGILREMFSDSFNDTLTRVFRNDSGTNNQLPPLSSLSKEVVNKFNERTYWDQKLYSRYVN